jgi:carbonic anhydrase
MKKIIITTVFSLLFSVVYAEVPIATEKATVISAKHAARHWGYTGEESPEHWASLGDQFALCGVGENQSPINITSQFDVDLPPLWFDYQAPASRVLNNGHTIQIDIAKGSRITLDNQEFVLKQFHFHTPSENTINGKHFPLEAHFVHRNEVTNHYAVVAVMFEEGEENALLQQVWQTMPVEKGQKTTFENALTYTQLIPIDKEYYQFNGSFTTPPCTEGVRWYVLKKPMPISTAQVTQFLSVMKHPNNRPVQKMNARLVVK